MAHRYRTTGDLMLEGEVTTDGLLIRAWVLYDPDPHGDIDQREIRIVRLALDPNLLGTPEAEHILEQAAEDNRA